jgi:hypothetical protein
MAEQISHLIDLTGSPSPAKKLKSSEEKGSSSDSDVPFTAPLMKVNFSLFGDEFDPKTLEEKDAHQFVLTLSDEQFSLFTKLIGRAIKSILSTHKLAPRVGAQQLISKTMTLHSLPLRGDPIIQAISRKLSALLSHNGFDINLGGPVTGTFRDAVLRVILPRVCSLSHRNAETRMTRYGSESLAIVLVSPALTLAHSIASRTGKLLRAVCQTVSVVINLIEQNKSKSGSSSSQQRVLPIRLLVCNGLGHCAQQGKDGILPKMQTKEGSSSSVPIIYE